MAGGDASVALPRRPLRGAPIDASRPSSTMHSTSTGVPSGKLPYPGGTSSTPRSSPNICSVNFGRPSRPEKCRKSFLAGKPQSPPRRLTGVQSQSVFAAACCPRVPNHPAPTISRAEQVHSDRSTWARQADQAFIRRYCRAFLLTSGFRTVEKQGVGLLEAWVIRRDLFAD
jgi:hypothetical protein